MAIGYNDLRTRINPSTGEGYHYALAHNWDIVITNAPEPLRVVTEFFGRDGIVNTSCTQVNNLPSSNLNEGIISGDVRGIPFHQPGTRESSVREVNLSLQEYYDYRVYRFFEAWKGMAVNRFDFSQDLRAMIPSGVSIRLTDSDRQNVKMTYNLYDVVCTKCSLGEMSSDANIVKVNVSLKCGHWNIFEGYADPTAIMIDGEYHYDKL